MSRRPVGGTYPSFEGDPRLPGVASDDVEATPGSHRRGLVRADNRYFVKIAAVVVASETDEPAAAPESVFRPAGSGTLTVDWLGLTTT